MVFKRVPYLCKLLFLFLILHPTRSALKVAECRRMLRFMGIDFRKNNIVFFVHKKNRSTPPPTDVRTPDTAIKRFFSCTFTLIQSFHWHLHFYYPKCQMIKLHFYYRLIFVSNTTFNRNIRNYTHIKIGTLFKTIDIDSRKDKAGPFLP